MLNADKGAVGLILALELASLTVGTTTRFPSSPGSEISTSTLPSARSIFLNFTPFCYGLPSSSQYGAGCTTNACAYVFTPPTSNSKYSTHSCISSFLPFAIYIVILLFLFTFSPSFLHKSSCTITISDPLSNSPSSRCCPITTTFTSQSGVANSTGISGNITKAAPTAGTLFCVHVWSTISRRRSPLSTNRSQTQMFSTLTSKIFCKTS